MSALTPDFDFSDNGSITLVTPLNDAAHAHLSEHTGGLWHCGVLAVESRYAPELSAELCRAGFVVELPDGRIVTEEDLRQ